MKNLINLLVFMVVPILGLNAQGLGLTFALGPSVTMYYGNSDNDFSYSPERLGWQLNGNFGMITNTRSEDRGNMLGIFGSAGSTHPEMIALLGQETQLSELELDMDRSFNEYYSLEVGMVVAEMLRLSGGYGQQFYTLKNGNKEFLLYYSGTLGVQFNMGAIKWVIDANLMTGKDLEKNALRFSTGFMVVF